jgi:RecA-family ATPase
MSTFGREADAKARWKRASRLNDSELLGKLDPIKRRMNGGASSEHPDDGITDAEPRLVWRHASEIELEPIVWLWPGRIAKGKHTCIAGDPGTGKSQLAIAIAAAVSMGCEWPCGEGRPPLGSVIILSAEDGAGDTILPRLHAAGADCGRVYIVDAVREEDGGERTFNLKSDLASLEKMIAERGDVVLVVIDTVNSYLGKTDSHKNAEVRAVLDPLSKMAERMRVAVLSITHFSKGGSNSTTKTLHRFLGSIGFVGSPRAAFATFEDPDDPDRRLFLHAKNNLAPPPQGLAYRLEQTIVGEPGQGIVASRVKWEPNPVTITANEALAADAASNSDKGFPREEAKDFLQQALADEDVEVDIVNAQAKTLGISEKTLKRARADLGVKASRVGGLGSEGVWKLSLPLRGPQSL